jgi:glycosyltransferase involved in cell wall biosynthesis
METQHPPDANPRRVPSPDPSTPSAKPAALFLSPEAPYPLAGGGALRSASLLQYLARTHHVDLLVFRQPGAPHPADSLPAGLVRRVFVIDLPSNGRSLAARAIRNGVRMARRVPPLVDRFSGFGGPIGQALEGRRYDLGIVEHFWCAPYCEQLSQVCTRMVLDLHNIESVLHTRCAEAPGAWSALAHAAFAHRVFSQASLLLERRWLPRYSQILATSPEDAGQLRAIAPGVRVTVYPNAIPLVPLPPALDENALVFSGNMEYHPNISAVRFFRGQVWPRLREQWPALVWRLVGRNPAAVARYTSGDPRIEVVGPVVNAVAELGRARVAVVPILAGSGTRFKILEAWAAGLPVVSTTVGAEGLPARDGHNLLLADGGAAFAEAVTRLLTCSTLRQSLGSAGRLLLEKEFTWDAAWKKLDF